MCPRNPHIQLSQEDKKAAEESLAVYCKPVELYNILQRRAIKHPLFLQKCLLYKLQAKRKRRIQISVSISRAIINGIDAAENLFPFYILLARPDSTANMEDSSVYRVCKACRLTALYEDETSEANFVLPEISKLSNHIKSGSLVMLLVSCADVTNGQRIDLTEDHMLSASGDCLMEKIPMDFIRQEWKNSGNKSSGLRVEKKHSISMHSCSIKLSHSDEGKFVSFGFQNNSETMVQVMVSAKDLLTEDTNDEIPDKPLPHFMRAKTGNVVFRYYNNMMQRTEVTEDFTCPFCLVKCASDVGMKIHLTCSHDLFCFKFWKHQGYQVVRVSVNTDTCNSEIAANYVDPKNDLFEFCYKHRRCLKPKSQTQNANHVRPLLLDSDVPEGEICNISICIPIPNASANGVIIAETESVPGNNLASPATLQFANTRNLSVEQSDPRNQTLLLKRQFFHSHRAQPMALEQVFAEQDSEDEVDDDVADLEDRRMLDDFVEVTSQEKQIMHLWNSFVRKQRVVADAHTPWACVAFTKSHKEVFLQNPQFIWCWRLFLVKLFNHGLLDAQTMNKCNVMINRYIRE